MYLPACFASVLSMPWLCTDVKSCVLLRRHFTCWLNMRQHPDELLGETAMRVGVTFSPATGTCYTRLAGSIGDQGQKHSTARILVAFALHSQTVTRPASTCTPLPAIRASHLVTMQANLQFTVCGWGLVWRWGWDDGVGRMVRGRVGGFRAATEQHPLHPKKAIVCRSCAPRRWCR
jgi:hypothetical protein